MMLDRAPRLQPFWQTGFNVCDQRPGSGFKTYWLTHDLGDSRLDPYGRSLAVWPLFEPCLKMLNSDVGGTDKKVIGAYSGVAWYDATMEKE